MIRVTVWNENLHEAVRKQENVLCHYPQGIHNCLAGFLKDEFSQKRKGKRYEKNCRRCGHE